ncbi:MAG: 16S rRNA (uracil(1498)-N(3))-methyltransferase [Bdellovibrionales bacterium]|jgi:16S rRNA (uracil1498-N3)-methyltransferase|nr:16S rRNA (uracil(1498)-N(3))-methyltransferase [Bdellovibrionales bacterium]
MRRYWLSSTDLVSSEIPSEVHFSGDLFHHIFEVCRQDLGSKFEVISPNARAYLVEVISRGKKHAVARTLESRVIAALPRPHLVLNLAISKFPVMDAVIEKAVEMGVHTIQPFYSDHSFLRQEGSISENKIDRWKKIIISATQQSGRGDLLTLAPAVHLKELLGQSTSASNTPPSDQQTNPSPISLGLFCYEGMADGWSLKDELLAARAKAHAANRSIDHLRLFVGSEGGFSTEEVELFRLHDLRPVSLGSQVLRVETACITLVSVLKYEFDLMR